MISLLFPYPFIYTNKDRLFSFLRLALAETSSAKLCFYIEGCELSMKAIDASITFELRMRAKDVSQGCSSGAISYNQPCIAYLGSRIFLEQNLNSASSQYLSRSTRPLNFCGNGQLVQTSAQLRPRSSLTTSHIFGGKDELLCTSHCLTKGKP